MIVDSSALLAILFDESDAKTYAQAIAESDSCSISAATFVEVAIVVEAQTKDAGLNFGDCFSYALAKTTGEPLLFKGEDFKKTDIACAL